MQDKHKGRPLVLKGCALFTRGHCAGAVVHVQHRPAPSVLLAILLLGAVVVEDAAPAAAVWLPVLVVLLLPMNFSAAACPKNAEAGRPDADRRGR